MNDAIDVGNEKAFAINEAQLRRHSETTTNHYLIAYCSGDGDLVVEPLTGSTKDRFARMRATCGDPVQTKNWAFAQWSYETASWKVLAGNGDVEQKLRDHIAKNKPRPR
jgi:hypothetical protein